MNLFVIHDAGDAAAGLRWQALVDGWPGPALAPDLPGHGSAPPPTGAAYAPGDTALFADRAIADAGWTGPVVVIGHGWGGFGAELLAAAGRVAQLVLVDGLGGPWVDVDQLVEEQHRWLRGVLADPDALAPPGDVPDPRLRHGFSSVWERRFTDARRRSITVPVLALESPASPTPPGERDERLAAFGGPATCVDVADASPEAVLAALTRDGISRGRPPAR